MTDEDELVHEALEGVLDLKGRMLTGWVLCYETLGPDGIGTAGHHYGPEGMSDWRALGLLEWARNFTIPRNANMDAEDDDDE